MMGLSIVVEEFVFSFETLANFVNRFAEDESMTCLGKSPAFLPVFEEGLERFVALF
jgi:hypothetical protein